MLDRSTAYEFVAGAATVALCAWAYTKYRHRCKCPQEKDVKASLLFFFYHLFLGKETRKDCIHIILLCLNARRKTFCLFRYEESIHCGRLISFSFILDENQINTILIWDKRHIGPVRCRSERHRCSVVYSDRQHENSDILRLYKTIC